MSVLSPPIPQELVDKIVSLACETSDVPKTMGLTLCLVSRSFLSRARRYVFNSLMLNEAHPPEGQLRFLKNHLHLLSNVRRVYISLWGSSQLFQAASKLVSLLSCHNTLPISLTLAHSSLLCLLWLSVKWPRVTSLTLRRLVYDDGTIVHLLNIFSELRTLDIGFICEPYNLYARHMGTIYPLVAHKSPVLQSLSYAPELGVACSIQDPVISTLLCSLQLTDLHVEVTLCMQARNATASMTLITPTPNTTHTNPQSSWGDVIR